VNAKKKQTSPQKVGVDEKGDQGRREWFRFADLPFYRLTAGEWVISALLALMVTGLIAYVAGPKGGVWVMVGADVIMLLGFAAAAYSLPRSSVFEKPVKRFKVITILSLMIVHFIVQMATWQF
jgi:hypothetical protein